MNTNMNRGPVAQAAETHAYMPTPNSLWASLLVAITPTDSLEANHTKIILRIKIRVPEEMWMISQALQKYRRCRPEMIMMKENIPHKQ